MRDHQKIVGLTAHQQNSEMLVKLMEHSYKPPQNIRKKEKLPPSDFYGKISLEILNPEEPFSLFLWFAGEGVCIVDLLIDGWILNSGRKNGVQVTDVVLKGSRIPLGFRSRGLIQATFWRVMKMDDGWFPDEGEKAYAVMQMYYRSPDTVLGPSSALNPSSIMSSPYIKQTIRYQDFVTSDVLPSDLGIDMIPENQENVKMEIDKLIDGGIGENFKDACNPARDVVMGTISGSDPIQDVSLPIQSNIDDLIQTSDDDSIDSPGLRHRRLKRDEKMSKNGSLLNATTPYRRRIPLEYFSHISSSYYRITLGMDTLVDELLETIQRCVNCQDILVLGRDCEGREEEIHKFKGLFDGLISLIVKAL